MTLLKIFDASEKKVRMAAILSHIYGTDAQVTDNMNMYYKMIGMDCRNESGFHDHVRLINFDGAKVQSFGACQTFSVILSDKSEIPMPSMILDKPNLTGMVHFYKKASG